MSFSFLSPISAVSAGSATSISFSSTAVLFM
jgi:hypothetical protein